MYSQFNTLALTFLNRMEETFPQEPKVRLYRQQFILVKDMNFKKPVEMFVENMEPFGEQILSKDELFFKQDTFVNSAQSISGKMGLIKYWDSLNDKTKDAIWEFVHALYVLGMSCLGKTKELQEVINRTGFKG